MSCDVVSQQYAGNQDLEAHQRKRYQASQRDSAYKILGTEAADELRLFKEKKGL